MLGFFFFCMKYEVFCPLLSDLWPFSPSLQRQVAGQVQAQPQDRTVNQIAMMLAIMGLSLSYYSAKQMTEKVNAQPAPWRGSTAGAIRRNNGWTNDKWWRWSEEVEVETQQCFWGPNFSHLTVIITLLGSLTYHVQNFLTGHWVFSTLSVARTFRIYWDGSLWVMFGLFSVDWFGWVIKTLTANWTWLLVITRLDACRMLSVLFWAIKCRET